MLLLFQNISISKNSKRNYMWTWEVLFTCTLFILGILGMPDVAIASDQGLVYEHSLGSFFGLFISCLTPDFFSASKRIWKKIYHVRTQQAQNMVIRAILPHMSFSD